MPAKRRFKPDDLYLLTYNTHAPSQVADRISRQIAWFESHKR